MKIAVPNAAPVEILQPAQDLAGEALHHILTKTDILIYHAPYASSRYVFEKYVEIDGRLFIAEELVDVWML